MFQYAESSDHAIIIKRPIFSIQIAGYEKIPGILNEKMGNINSSTNVVHPHLVPQKLSILFAKNKRNTSILTQ